MPSINREELLSQLESVQAGLSQKEVYEQSSCFVFQDGRVLTFNEDVACSLACPLEGIEGAVQADALLKLLHKMKGETLSVEQENGNLILTKGRERVRLKMESEITLPVAVVEKPGKNWTELSPEFLEALAIVQECAAKDETRYDLTCVHIHPKWLEATDQYQFIRYRLKTGETESILVKKSQLSHIVGLGMTEFNRTSTWIHFRNPTGVQLSCQWAPSADYEFPTKGISKFLETKGVPLSLPKGLADAAEKAAIISSNNTETDEIKVTLKNGQVRVVGYAKDVGKYERYFAKIKYSGRPLSFTISPKLFQEIVKRHPEALITENLIRVDGGRWQYAACLGIEEK